MNQRVIILFCRESYSDTHTFYTAYACYTDPSSWINSCGETMKYGEQIMNFIQHSKHELFPIIFCKRDLHYHIISLSLMSFIPRCEFEMSKVPNQKCNKSYLSFNIMSNVFHKTGLVWCCPTGQKGTLIFNASTASLPGNLYRKLCDILVHEQLFQ